MDEHVYCRIVVLGGIIVDAMAVRVYSRVGILNVLKVVWGRRES